MIMKNIKINILGLTDNELHWHYEIVIDGKRFISGWYRYSIWYLYYNKNMKQYIKHVYSYNNGLSKREVKKVKNECVLITKETPYIITGVTQEIVDFITERIRVLYKDILDKQ